MCQKTNTLKQRIGGKLMLQELTLNYVIKIVIILNICMKRFQNSQSYCVRAKCP